MKQVACADLGVVPYGEALLLQRRLQQLRREGRVPDLLLALQHPPVITVGRLGKPEHILAPPRVLAKLGVEVHWVERGGDVTYHGPGQLILYPIFDLREHGRDLRRFIASLEEVMLRVARAFGVEAHRHPGFPGIWLGLKKLGSVGVHVRGWVTMHGLALNVDLKPNLFPLIVPCGLHGVEAASLAEVASQPVSLEEAHRLAREAFSQVVGVELVPLDAEVLSKWSA
jgi:lipoate-protein ligase B